jgi:prepilin-type N-terminal cleavage/methylation domain-containing protein
MKTKFKKQKGFTLVEILLVVGLFGFLAGISIPVYSGFIDRSNLSSSVDVTQAAILRARKYAQTQRNNSNWGVYYQTGQIIVFAGDSFDTRDTALDEVTNIPETMGLSVDSDREVVFEQISGTPLSNGARIEFESPLQNTNTISIDPDGEVKRRDLESIISSQPSSIGGLQVWLRGDSNITLGSGNEVSAWGGLEPAATVFTAPSVSERPSLITGALNGHDGLSFDGSNDYLESSSIFPASSSLSMIVVAQVANPDQDSTLIGGSGSSEHALRYDDNRGDRQIHFQLASQDPALFSPNVTVSGEWNVFFVTYDHTTKRGELYENLRLSSVANLDPDTDPLDTDMQIGAVDGGRHFEGIITEIAVFDRVLTRSERQALHQYIEDRYGLIMY